MNCIIIDDEASAINILKRYIEDVPNLNLLSSFENSIEGLQYVNNNNVELIFLDINMPNLNGISFMSLLNNKSKVILTTAYSEYALEGYKYDVIDYLLKPFSFESFLKASMKAIGQSAEAQLAQAFAPVEDYIMVQTENKGKYKKINYSEINYAEAMLNYAAIVTLNGERVVLHISMKELIERLPPQLFIRIHKSYIVALKQIKYIEASEVILQNEVQKLPLGLTYKDSLFKILDARILK
ncbi:MAG: LytTR family DNA-binding domain-containing protein [Bacteroidota bacterium]